jgi:hypothetical protein
MATRNRVIYQSEALYVGQPEGDGFHYKATRLAAPAVTDANDVPLTGEEFALVGDPSTTSEECIVNATQWTLISKPAIDPPEWTTGQTYNKEDYDAGTKAATVKYTKTLQGIAKTWYFEAILDHLSVANSAGAGSVTNGYEPLRSLNDVIKGADELDFAGWDFHSGVKQLQRVQSANYSFSINRQDVNQFGQLSRIDSVAIDPPTVSLDFSYYLTNGLNEKILGLNIDTKDNLDLGAALNFVKTDKQEEDSSGRNFFILTTPQGTDAVGSPDWDTVDNSDQPGIPSVGVDGVAAKATLTITDAAGIKAARVAAMPDFFTIDGVQYLDGQDWDSSGAGNNEDLANEIKEKLNVVLNADNAAKFVVASTVQDGATGNYVIEITTTLATKLANYTFTTSDSQALIASGSFTGGTDPILTTAEPSACSTIALGNGFITQYTAEASVGGMPTASVTIEGLNLKSDSGFHNIDIPSVNNERGTPTDGITYSLPKPISGVLDDGSTTDDVEAGFSCLRPGDIEMHLGSMVDGSGSAGLMNPLPHGAPPTDHTTSSCHIQSFSIDVPMSRTPIQRLGTPWAYTRPLDFPLTVSVSVSAIVADLKSGNVADQLFNNENHDLHFILREPTPDGNGPVAMAYYIRGAQLEGESFSSSIGDNKTVDITFTCQVGGPSDKSRGLMVAGSRGAVQGQGDNESQIGGELSCLTNFDPFVTP